MARNTPRELITLRHRGDNDEEINIRERVGGRDVTGRGMEMAGGRIKIPAGPARERGDSGRGILTICSATLREEKFKSPLAPRKQPEENYFSRHSNARPGIVRLN